MTRVSDINHDELRREAAEIDAEHRQAMPRFRDALSRLFSGESKASEDDRARAVIGMDRRSLFKVGGVVLLGGAVMAACGGDNSGNSSSSTATTAGAAAAAATTAPAAATPAMGDVTILRTASSIEELAIAAYQTAITSGLVKTQAIADAAQLFQAQHREHSAQFQAATKAAGGEPFVQPNPVVLAAIKPMVDALADERGVVALAFELETAAAQSYQAYVGTFADAKLNKAIMAVGGVEARHAAVLAQVLNSLGDTTVKPVPAAFQVTDKAIKSGTGV
ncbi:MAG TPA: ferritin-like domain-containing protein [Acidimicrobiales bacterium]|jgi:rubrerythrin